MQRGTAEERKRGGRWVLLCTTAALLLFAAGPVPRSAAASRAPAPMRSSLVARDEAPASSPTPPARPVSNTRSPELGPGIDGAVIALDGPVPGLRVAATTGAGLPVTGTAARASFTDEAGRFRLREAAPAPQRLIALGADGALLEGPLVPSLAAERSALRWELEWRLVRVQLRDAAGNPLVGARVRCSSPTGAPCFAVRHASDAEGRCAALVRGADTVEFVLERPGSPPASAHFAAGDAEHGWTLDAR
ncbi:MAG: hypothetical protein JNM84_03440 [Planctomycetes bacterium]|nr:hypothetical protein [Planctomycetota bacterium]